MTFERATAQDLREIDGILQQARAFLCEQGVDQWQTDGPTAEETQASIANGTQYLLRAENGVIAGVCTVVPYEPDYNVIDGAWKTDGRYLAVHRVAVAKQYRGKGIPALLYRGVEALARAQGIYSLRADTHADNVRMQATFTKNGFTYCGIVSILGGRATRKAYEKVLLEEDMAKTVVAATGNKHKVEEFRSVLSGWTVLTAKEAGFVGDVEETGVTFLENAIIKAQAIAQATGLPALADDSGLCVDALDGAPGIYSARYSGGGDQENRDFLLRNMQDITDRSAYFACAIALCYPDGRTVTAEGRTYGRILYEECGSHGFGYDCLFFSDDLQKSFGEATEEEKNGVSHRGRALRLLEEKL